MLNIKLCHPEKRIIPISVFWAILMLVSAWVMQGFEHAGTIIMFMIGGWYVSFSMLSTSEKTPCNKTKD